MKSPLSSTLDLETGTGPGGGAPHHVGHVAEAAAGEQARGRARSVPAGAEDRRRTRGVEAGHLALEAIERDVHDARHLARRGLARAADVHDLQRGERAPPAA